MEGVESAFLAGVQCPGFAAIQQYAEHAGLVLVVSMELSYTLVARRAIAVEALPILVLSSVSRERLLEMVEPRWTNSSITSRV